MSRAAQQEALKLLALAKSAISIGSLDEARNASFAACKLIIANGLMVVMKDDLVTFVMPPQSATDTRTQREQTPPRPSKRRKRQPIIDTETKDAIVDAAGDFASRLVSSAIRDVVRGR